MCILCQSVLYLFIYLKRWLPVTVSHVSFRLSHISIVIPGYIVPVYDLSFPLAANIHLSFCLAYLFNQDLWINSSLRLLQPQLLFLFILVGKSVCLFLETFFVFEHGIYFLHKFFRIFGVVSCFLVNVVAAFILVMICLKGSLCHLSHLVLFGIFNFENSSPPGESL